MGPGVLLVEGHKGLSAALSPKGGVHHQGVEHHHLLGRHVGVPPGGPGVLRHLVLVDLGGGVNYALPLQHKQSPRVQGGQGGLLGGVDPPNPAHGRPALLLLG